MKIIAERAALLRAVGRVNSVVERRNTIPILDNLLLQVENAEDGVLTVAGTDMDMEMVTSLKVQATGAGKTTVPAGTLHDILKKLPDGCQVELDGPDAAMQMKLHAGRSTFKLNCVTADDYPILSRGDMRHNFSVPAAALRNLLERVRFAVSTEETRYYLNGIYLHAPDGLLRACATDGHRLALTEIALPDGASGMSGIIIPRKAIGELVKLLDGIDDDVEVSVSDTKIRVFAGDSALLSKVIDGTFPEYDRIIPKNNDLVIELDTAAFSGALGRVSTMSTEKARSVRANIEAGKITLSVFDSSRGQAVEDIEARYTGTPLEVGFNSRYLSDILARVGVAVGIEMRDGLSPVLFKDPGDAASVYVLMPMRV